MAADEGVAHVAVFAGEVGGVGQEGVFEDPGAFAVCDDVAAGAVLAFEGDGALLQHGCPLRAAAEGSYYTPGVAWALD